MFFLLLLYSHGIKSNTLPWVFFTLLDRTNGTKSRNASHIYLTSKPQLQAIISSIVHCTWALEVSVKNSDLRL